MDLPSSSYAILLRAAVIVPASIAVARLDIVKYRSWRERSRRWHREGRQPPAEYQRDNILWRWRLVSFGVMLFGMSGFIVSLEDMSWLTWPLYATAMTGAAAWNILGSFVR